MAVSIPTTIGAAGTTAFGAQALVPIIHWLGEHYNAQPAFTPEFEYSLSIVAIAVVGAALGVVVTIGRALLLRWLRRHNIKIPEGSLNA